MPLNQTAHQVRPTNQDGGADAPQPGWWQAASGRWFAPVTDTTCGNGHPMDGDRAFCRACRAPRAEFAIESASPLDPAAIAAVAERATPSTYLAAASATASTSVTTPTSPVRKRALQAFSRRRAS
jgi:hypothetical protein